MRWSLLSLVLLISGIALSHAATPSISNPKTFVAEVYRRLATEQLYSPPKDIYTRHLASLWEEMERDANGEAGRVDFLFWVNAQDWELKNVVVSAVPVFGRKDRQIITAKFLNAGKRQEIRFYFEKVGNNWLLDDARSAGKNGWTLSVILKYGFDQ